MYRFAMVTVGWEAVTGDKCTISDVVDRIGRFSLSAVMGIVGRITLALNQGDEEGQSNLDRQLRIAALLMGAEGADALIELVRHRDGAEFDPNGFVLFHERQGLNALKLAFLVADHDAPEPPPEKVVTFVEALLMLNDLIDPQAGSIDMTTADGRAAMELYVSANILFNESQPLVRD